MHDIAWTDGSSTSRHLTEACMTALARVSYESLGAFQTLASIAAGPRQQKIRPIISLEMMGLTHFLGKSNDGNEKRLVTSPR